MWLNPYTVLGTQIQAQGSGTKIAVISDANPRPRDILVDPAGLQFIQSNTPQKAGKAASGAIYKFLGIDHEGGFPDHVVNHVRDVGHAR
eukprot:13210551-Alexandrium_andersonii.AAC.1